MKLAYFGWDKTKGYDGREIVMAQYLLLFQKDLPYGLKEMEALELLQVRHFAIRKALRCQMVGWLNHMFRRVFYTERSLSEA